MTAPNGIGNELGTGLGAFAQQFVGTQNTIRQQQDALAQQQLDNQYRDQQFVAQQAQQATQQDYQNRSLAQTGAYQNATLAANAGINNTKLRMDDFQNVVGPAYTGEKEALSTQMTQAQGTGDLVAYQHAKDRMKQLQSLMSKVNLGTQSDETYQPARQNLLSFLGVPGSQTQAAPATGTTAPAPTAPAPMDYTFGSGSNPMGVQATPASAAPDASTGTPAPIAPTPAAAPAAPPAPPTPPGPPPQAPPPAVSSDLDKYTDIRQIPIPDLVKMDPAALNQKFGDGASTYFGLHKVAYDQAQAAQQVLTQKERMDDWKLRLTEFAKRTDLTPEQNTALDTLTRLNTLPALDSGQQTQMTAAYQTLAPQMYTPESWSKVVASKDPQQIASMYPVYKAANPSSVAGFDPAPYQTLADAANTETASKAATAAHTATLSKYLNGATDLKTADLPTLVSIQQNPQALLDFGITSNEGREALSQAIINKRNGDTATADELLAKASGAQNTNATNTDDQLRTNALGGTKSFVDLASKGASALPILSAIQSDPAKMHLFGMDTPAGQAAVAALMKNITDGNTADASKAAATLTQMADAHRASITTTGDTAYKQASLQLGAIAGTDLSAVALQKRNPGLWFSLKQGLGTPGQPLTDATLTALFDDAKTSANDKNAATQLDAKIRAAQLTQMQASTAQTVQATGAAQAELPLKLSQLNAQISDLQLKGQDTSSLIAERTTLLGGKVAAQTLTNAKTQVETTNLQTMGPLNAQNLSSQIVARTAGTQRAADLLKGQIGIQQADIAKISAGTLYEQTRTPGTPQYIPAATKGSDPNAPVYKQAGALVASAKAATQQAGVFNNNLNALIKANTTPGIPFDINRLPDATKGEYQRLITKRDALLDSAAGYVKQSNDVMQKLTVPAGTSSGPQSSITPTQYKTIATTITPGAGEKPQETRFLNALRGAEGNPNYGLVTESTGNTQQDRALALSKLRNWASQYTANAGHFAGQNPQHLPAMSGGDFTRDFVGKFSGVYAPQGVANDPTGLNANHAGNLMGFMSAGGWKGGQTTPAATITPAATTPPPVSAGTPLPVVKPTSGFKADPNLESGLITGVKNSDPDAINSFGAQMLTKGYTQAQVMALIKKAQTK